MADEDEVDVEGDFDMNIGIDNEAVPNLYLDMNEPPSKSANLLPEYTQHPWMLEQGWSLDHCTDEKSKAAIERMLQEEQHYMNGRVTVTKVTSTAHPSASFQKQAQQRRAWTDEERETFQKGLEIYGRKWARIAELIPDKTTQQVKSFGQHFFKIKAREEEEKKRKDQKTVAKTHLPIGIQNAIRAVTTAQPTVKVSPKKLSTYYDSSSLVWTEPPPSSISLRTSPPPIQPKKESMSVPSVTTTAPKRNSPPKGRRGKPTKPSKPTKDKVTTGKTCQSKASYSVPIVKTEPKVNSLIASSEVVRILSNRSEDSDDSDVDIDIDVEDDEWSAGAGPIAVKGEDTVYRQLVESAGINPSHMNGEEEEEESHENHSSEDDCNDHLHLDRLSAVDIKVESGSSEQKEVPVVNQIKTEPDEHTSPLSEVTAICDLGSTDNTFLTEQLYGVLPPTPPDQILSLPSTSKLKETEIDLQEGDSQNFQETRDKPAISEKSGDVGITTTLESTLKTSSVTSDDSSRTDQLADCSSVSEEEDNDDHPDEFGILTSLGDIVYLPNPTEAMILDCDSITDQEQEIHSEFFSQRPGAKTPDRYLKIRNFILDAWERCRPHYLNKTSVRPGLKNCGDVNCIGRIHAYLEQVGAINFGCNQVQYLRSNRTVPVKVKVPKEPDQQALRNDMRVRKRRVRDTQGDWVDENDLEGKTIEHKEAEKLEKKQKMIRLRTSYDPFQLIPCLDFSEEQPAPFGLTMESCASVVMDVHAHLSKTEVIGLLGGAYCRDRRQLTVTMALPCDSLSTGMQCEMDPVSQTEACEAIERRGQSVVGWYHSHPTFTPDPSCRDIETQHKYQDWFGKGGNPFIGVIVSPYCHGRLDAQSVTRCLVVVNKSDTQSAGIGQPYQFAYQLSHAQWDTERFRQQLAHLADKYATYPYRVYMLQHFTSRSALTCLQKMVESLSHSFPESPPEGQAYLRELVEDVIGTKYSPDEGVGGPEEGVGGPEEGVDGSPPAPEAEDDMWLSEELPNSAEVALPADCLPADLLGPVTPSEVH